MFKTLIYYLCGSLAIYRPQEIYRLTLVARYQSLTLKSDLMKNKKTSPSTTIPLLKREIPRIWTHIHTGAPSVVSHDVIQKLKMIRGENKKKKGWSSFDG